MALPENRLSTLISTAPFEGPRNKTVTRTQDFEWGGVAIQDPSLGLQYQEWVATVTGNGTVITLAAENTPAHTYIIGAQITEVSLAFDQNMNVVLVYVEGGQAKLWWYDPLEEEMTTTTLDPEMESPRVSLDDKRPRYAAGSDVILAYIKNNNLYHLRQRDRYQVPYLLFEDLPRADGDTFIRKIGMNVENRFQFELFTQWNQEQQLAYTLDRAAAATSEGPYTPSAVTVTTFDAGSSTVYKPDNAQED